jgi:hypothetical protein
LAWRIKIAPRFYVGDIVALDDYVGSITEYDANANHLVITVDGGLKVIPTKSDIDKIGVVARPIRYCKDAIKYILAQASATAENANS